MTASRDPAAAPGAPTGLAALDPATLVAWISAVALGDRAAYRRLYDATSSKLFAVAVRILRDEGRAEDVLQDSFVNVWNAAGGYDARLSQPMTWLVTIVRNRSLDYVRRVERNTVELDDDLQATLESDQASPVELASRGQDATALRRCLGRLDAGQRQAIASAYYQGLTHSELAETLRIPIGTVKTWIRRGLEKMRRCLDGVPG